MTLSLTKPALYSRKERLRFNHNVNNRYPILEKEISYLITEYELFER